MSRPIVEVENVSKRYKLGQFNARTLRDEVDQFFRRLRRKNEDGVPHALAESSEFWALKEVSFSVQTGEVVGIIGRNGAGKSTLLKILSRVTEPTSGEIRIRGRVASLLEVGTGFHPELTGRENIYLNGTILGMTKAEVKAKFDEIVAFAEIDKFLDTPVKRYSSGMYVRLAFAVAAHLEPEILIVDEVLAVGDAAFQKKCLGKMGDVAREGRTILFVSHNMQAISVLCSKAIILEEGQITDRGLPRALVERHLSSGTLQSAEVVWPFETAPSSHLVKLHAVRVCAADGKVSFNQRIGAPVTLTMDFWCLRETRLVPNFHLYNQGGVMVFPTATLHVKELAQKVYEPGLYRSSCVVPADLLNSSTYFVHAFLSRETDGHPYVHVPEAVSFQVNNDGTGQGDVFTGADWPGVIRPLLPWTSRRIGDLTSTP
jgi:lipopolysaccharide transport system ATP-binding protein